ncbi:MAG: BON domain-containing protein [Bryobacterales bacterium]|nr:BON domain-containing protein [Bryobacterales bacterium]
MKKSLMGLAIAMLLAAPSMFGAVNADKVRKELVTLPFYSIFDNFSFRVDGSTVTLMGSVTRPTLKSSAENVTARVEGVEHVVNQIEVLPLSPADDRIRWRMARAIYGQTALNRYALGAQPSIRIIVKNGDVRLEGIVGTEMDRNIAFLAANGVPGVFTVENHLRVERGRSVS